MSIFKEFTSLSFLILPVKQEGGHVKTDERYLAEDGEDIYIRELELVSIKNKVCSRNEESFASIVSASKPYGLRAETMLAAEKYGLPKFLDSPTENGYRVLGLVEKQKRDWKYLPFDYPIPKHFVPKLAYNF